MREAKKLDHCPARDPFGEPLQQPIEHAPVGLAREELVAIDKIQQRHRFAPKRMDDMAIIDDMAMFAAALGAAARKRKERCAAEEQLKPIVVKSPPQTMADKPRRHGVEQLGRAWGRDRVCQSGSVVGVAGSYKKKKKNQR